MAHTIKISGVSPELLSLVDDRWKGQHYADRSEYVRDLIRRDVVRAASGAANLADSARKHFGAVHDAVALRGDSDEEISADVGQALAEVRSSRKDRPAPNDKAA